MATSLVNFWNSAEVNHIITRTLADIKHVDLSNEDTPCWRILQSTIIGLNTRGRVQLPPPLIPPRSYCLDQLFLEPDDGSSSYIPFRRCLGVVADLLQLFRKKIEKGHGHECWKKASILFEDEPRSSLFFGLLRDVSAAPRPQGPRIKLNAISGAEPC